MRATGELRQYRQRNRKSGNREGTATPPESGNRKETATPPPHARAIATGSWTAIVNGIIQDARATKKRATNTAVSESARAQVPFVLSGASVHLGIRLPSCTARSSCCTTQLQLLERRRVLVLSGCHHSMTLQPQHAVARAAVTPWCQRGVAAACRDPYMYTLARPPRVVRHRVKVAPNSGRIQSNG